MKQNIMKQEYRDKLIGKLIAQGYTPEHAKVLVNGMYRKSIVDAVSDRLRTIANNLENGKYDDIRYSMKVTNNNGYVAETEYVSFDDVTDLDDMGDVLITLNDIERERKEYINNPTNKEAV